MSRAQKQRRKAGKSAQVRDAKATAVNVSKFSGTEERDPIGGPKGPSDPGARVVEWKK